MNSEHEDRQGGSAMTMYTEDFEDSGPEDSQASFHLAFTRSKSAENGNIKQRSDQDDSSTSTHSKGSSVSSTRPVRSSSSPEKAKSRRMKAKTEVNGERKITVSQEDREVAVSEAFSLRRSSSEESNKHAEESEGNYTDDFHSAASELANISSDAASVDSVDASQHGMLDFPPAANNLGYTY